MALDDISHLPPQFPWALKQPLSLTWGIMWDSVPCFKAAASSSTSWKLSCSLVAHLLNPPFHTGGVSSLGSSSEQTDLRRGRKTASGVLRVRGCLVGIIVATSLHLGTRPESRI